MPVRKAIPLILFAGFAATAQAQVLTRDGRLIYPPEAQISRALTPVERQWLRQHPEYFSSNADLVTPPPAGPIHCAAEYEPMEGIIITWVGGQTAIQGQMGRWITTTGTADLWVVLPSAATQASATTTLTNAGANMSRVRFVTPTSGINSVWQRDYGPRYIFEGPCRAIVDHQYNRPRPLDDAFPAYFGTVRAHQFYALGLNATQLIHGGGNFHLDALNRSYATRLTVNENPTLTEPQIVNIWGAYQGLQHTFFNPFPTTVDATQHIDMWMQVVADDKVIISDFVNPTGNALTADAICDQAAVTMATSGYTVYRVPAYSLGGVHYTYTNMVMCNGVVMIPSYTNATVAPSNAAALATISAAVAPKTVQQINCEGIIGLAGAIHCIVMHVPAHRGAPGPGGGLAPTAYLKSPAGCQALTPGLSAPITWISDDDAAVTSVDLLLSTDGGQTFPTTIASGLSALGSYNWTVPALDTSLARIRVVARDAQNNSGFDDSDWNFTIGAVCAANCDGSTTAPVLNVNDFICFQQRYASGDCFANCDGSTTAPVLNVNDFICFQSKFAAGCP
jgi:agmatine/peptidylarginine deiminase